MFLRPNVFFEADDVYFRFVGNKIIDVWQEETYGGQGPCFYIAAAIALPMPYLHRDWTPLLRQIGVVYAIG